MSFKSKNVDKNDSFDIYSFIPHGDSSHTKITTHTHTHRDTKEKNGGN